MIFSCASESVRKPMRLAGTCSRYSKSAMLQLTIAATHHGRSARLRRCAYHAKVMNTFEAMSSRMVGSAADIPRFYLRAPAGAESAFVLPVPRFSGGNPRNCSGEAALARLVRFRGADPFDVLTPVTRRERVERSARLAVLSQLRGEIGRNGHGP